jgi:hypothetical protein
MGEVMRVEVMKQKPGARGASRLSRNQVERGDWLLLVHQLPTSPSRARVKTWRRLQQLGAVAIRNAVYVLPDSPQAREDFEWLKTEIVAEKGEASVFVAKTIDALTRDDIVAAFRADRERLYQSVRAEAGELIGSGHGGQRVRGLERRRLERAARQLRARLTQVADGDAFRAGGRAEAEATVDRLERLLDAPAADRTSRHEVPVLKPRDYRRKIWITRPRPGVDRCGSAWLIRRFVDPDARFVFGKRPAAARKAIPFDMYDVEFSHQADRCTFEVLADRFGVADPAVARLGRAVHDLDLKENRYHVAEAVTLGRLIDGLRETFSKDDDLLAHGMALFEALYRACLAGPPRGAQGTEIRVHEAND